MHNPPALPRSDAVRRLVSSCAQPPVLLRREWLHGMAAVVASTALLGCGRSDLSLETLRAQVQGIAVGNPAGQPLLVFFDTRCGYCARLWKGLVPHQPALAMLWVPVAILSAASEGEAMALLGSPNPAQALALHMQRFGSGPIAAQSAPMPSLQQALAGNRAALNALPTGRESVPQSVAAGGSGVRVAVGAQPWADFKSTLGL